METVKAYGDWIIWGVSLFVALGVIWKWIAKPIRDTQSTTDMLMGDRLSQAHDYWMHKRYCPPQDRRRLIDMHKVYAGRGLNHLTDSYERDLLELPDEPPGKRGES